MIVISGTPGTGKTSVSRLAAQRLGVRLFSLSELAAEGGAITGRDECRDTFIVEEARLKRFLNRFLSGLVGVVIVEGHFGDLTPKKYVDCCIVLRTHPAVLERRLGLKGYGRGKIFENVQAEILGSCTFNAVRAYGASDVYELDTSYDTVDVSVDKFLKIVNERPAVFLAGWVNWLSGMSEGELRKYFNY